MPFVDPKDMWWNAIDRQLQSLRQPLQGGYSLTERGTNRHGAWEWVFCRLDEEVRLTRYVVAAFTPLHTTFPDRALFDLNLWAGADTEDRFTRVWISSDRLEPWGLQDHAVHEMIEHAFGRAEQLTLTDLDNNYLRLRSHTAFEGSGAASRHRDALESSNAIDSAPPRRRPTRGTFRKRAGSDTWHWCLNCSHWPTSDYIEERGPRSDALCNECLAKERRGNCSREEGRM